MNIRRGLTSHLLTLEEYYIRERPFKLETEIKRKTTNRLEKINNPVISGEIDLINTKSRLEGK